MKKIFCLAALASMLAVGCTKERNGADDLIPHNNAVEDNPNGGGGNNTTSIPAAVQAAFNTRYPNATSIQWKRLSNGNYKAEFMRGTVRWQAIFTPAGVLVKEEHD